MFLLVTSGDPVRCPGLRDPALDSNGMGGKRGNASWLQLRADMVPAC